MVSANPNPPAGLFAAGPFVPPPAASPEEAGKKARKPYTISKSRESWTEIEHDKFLEAFNLFDRDWKKIEAFVNSKTVIQVQKNGKSEHVPAPRPKRKAAHPYPHKASKIAPQLSQARIPLQSPGLFEPAYDLTTDISSKIQSSTNVMEASWNQDFAPPVNVSLVPEDDLGPTGSLMGNDYSCSSTDSPGTSRASVVTDRENISTPMPVVPDFARVYDFLGSIFDPNTADHIQKLKEMNPIDVSTVLLLVRNLSVNLTSPEFEAHRRLLSSYGNVGTQEAERVGPNMLQTSETTRIPFMV